VCNLQLSEEKSKSKIPDVAMVMVVMVMVVEMTIEKGGLTERMQYEKFASFRN
jgi:hypothetical protein